MTDDVLYPPPLDRLKELGPLFSERHEAVHRRDYVAELGVTAEHVPALIQIARLWLDAHGDDCPVEPELWAPIHAWRALGQLGAVEAVEPLLGMMDALDEADDEWYPNEFLDVFLTIGPDASDALRRYLADRSHGDYPRDVAARVVTRLVQRRPECRDTAIAAIAAELADCKEHSMMLNAFFICHLLELKAVEQAELIERAFAAGCVDDEICGNWGDVREELGVEGLGLLPDRPARPRRDLFFRYDLPGDVIGKDPNQRQKERKKLKAKRKQQQKSRKRNRKRK